MLCLVLLAYQSYWAVRLLTTGDDEFLRASEGLAAFGIHSALCLTTGALVWWLPARLRLWALAPGTIALAAVVSGSFVLGHHALGAIAAALTFAGSWWLGHRLLSGPLRSPLSGHGLVELLLGFAGLGIIVLLLGRLSLIAWWSTGLVVVLLGAAGLATLLRLARPHAGNTIAAVRADRVTTLALGLMAAQLAWIVIWVSAPDLQYDALYGKAYVTDLWARTGSMGTLLEQPVMNLSGLAQVIAVPGRTLGAVDGGRWLQTFAGLVLAGGLWSLAKPRSPLGPLSAALFVMSPVVVWQAATAYDDLLISLAAFTIVAALLGSPRSDPHRTRSDTLRLALTLGALAGAGVWFKLHVGLLVLLPIALWLVAAPADRLARAACGMAGAVLIAGPQRLLTWIDSGNPLFPAMNGLFRSPYFPPVSTNFNFPRWPEASLIDLLGLPWYAISPASPLSPSQPPNSYGVLAATLVVAVALLWRARGTQNGTLLWVGVMTALLAWWVGFRELRYLLPIMVAAAALVIAALRTQPWPPRAAGAAAVGVVLASITLFPSTLARFWLLPGRDVPYAAAFGRWQADDYVQTALPEVKAIKAFTAASEPGAGVISDGPSERIYAPDRTLALAWETMLVHAARVGSLTAPPPTLAELRAMGITWLISSSAPLQPTENPSSTPWWANLIADHGTPVYGDSGYVLYRLDDRAKALPDDRSCDPELTGATGCWDQPGLDRTPGATDGEHATRTVPLCPGQLLAVDVTTGPGTGQTRVTLTAEQSGNNGRGFVSRYLDPSTEQTFVLTVPEGASHVTVDVVPSPGATARRVETRASTSCR